MKFNALFVALGLLALISVGYSQKPAGAANPADSSQISAGEIKVVLQKAEVISRKLHEGTKYTVRFEWDMTFSDFVERAGFRYKAFGRNFVRYGVRNVLFRNPFQTSDANRWFSRHSFTLANGEAPLTEVDGNIWFVSKSGQRWESDVVTAKVVPYKPVISLPNFGGAKDSKS